MFPLTSAENSYISLKKNFSNGSKIHKIFKKNNVKISYSCIDNMERIIDAHNKKFYRKPHLPLITVIVKIQKTALCRETAELRTLYTKLTLHQSKNRKCTLDYAKQSLKQDIIIISHHFHWKAEKIQLSLVNTFGI